MTARTGFAGDWHGNLAWALASVNLFAANDITTIYHVGDFGIWPGEEKYLQRLDAALAKNGQKLYVTLGNHENYRRIAKFTLGNDGWFGLPEYPNTRYAPRAHVWEDRGVRMASLGGAGSIDRLLRVPDRDWWAGEEITDEDVTAFRDLVTGQGWDRVDVAISHEAPAGLRRVGMAPAPEWATPEVVAYTYHQRVRLREAMDEAAPRWLVHGHWHEFYNDAWEGVNYHDREYQCRVIGLHRDKFPMNLMIADMVPGVGLVNLMVQPYVPPGGTVFPVDELPPRYGLNG